MSSVNIRTSQSIKNDFNYGFLNIFFIKVNDFCGRDNL